MNYYLVRIYSNVDTKKVKPKEVWLKANNFIYLKNKVKENNPKIRQIELLQTVKGGL